MESALQTGITAKSYFSGAGGMDEGMKQAGIEVIQSLEIDAKASATLKLNCDHEVITEDIANMMVLSQPSTNINLFTYPCTKYSTIGDIHNVRKGDDLYCHALRHMYLEQSDMWIVENVPGMLMFPVVMEAMTQQPGYHIQAVEIDANIWLPQNRKRLIIVGTKQPFKLNIPTVSIPDKPSLASILESDPEVSLVKACYERMKPDGERSYRDAPIISDPADITAHAPCAVAHYHKDRSTRMVKDENVGLGVRPYTPLEWASLQGFPTDYKWAGTNNDIYKQVGNAVAVPLGKWLGIEATRYFNQSAAIAK